jgi:hypothetical protein
VHYLVQERTDTSVTVFLYFETSYGSTFELYEFHADEDADYATAVRMISRDEIFEGNIRSAQKVITLNGEAPYATFETADLVDLANGALEGRVPAEDDDEQATHDEDEAEDDAAAVTEALEKIRTHADALVGSIGDFTDLLAIESLSQEEADLANEIIALWQAAPAEAASVDLPSAYRKIERTYADLADALDQAATSIIALLEGTGDESEHVDLVTMSFAAAEEAGSELDELLTDVGV